MKWFGRLLLNGLGVYIISQIVPNIFVGKFSTAFWVAFVLGLLNTFIRPALRVLTMPINIVTLGLFSFVINAFLFWLTSKLISNFEVSGFFAALVGSLLMVLVNAVADRVVGTDKAASAS